MPKVAILDMEGAQVGEIELSENTFGAPINTAVLHLVVRAQLNAKRQGTKSALTRSEVRGGGKKPWRQKGTGRARQGSTRAPQWTHGGVVFAPKPRSFEIAVPRKVRRLAMKGALTAKVQDGDIIVLRDIKLAEAKTRLVAGMLKKLGVDGGKALIVIPGRDESVVRAARNIAGVKTAYVNTLNVLDILGYTKFIITQDAVKLVEEVYQ